MVVLFKKVMEIKLKPYEYTCGDGCCYTTGYDVYLDGEHIGMTYGEDAEELAEVLNEYFDRIAR